jgi:hypothetical protein
MAFIGGGALAAMCALEAPKMADRSGWGWAPQILLFGGSFSAPGCVGVGLVNELASGMLAGPDALVFARRRKR